jgi:putative ABC transport system permease protein
MLAINRKLARDLWHTRSQGLAIASVVGAGVAMFVLMISTFDSLSLTQTSYYERFRFADVFASLRRAPLSLAADIAAIPGVAASDERVVVDVSLDVPGLDAPASGRLISLPEEGRPILNDVFVTEGRYVEPYRDNEVLASDTFARDNGLHPGDSVVAIINGHRRRLDIVGLALSPEYVYAIRPGELVADEARFGIFWMGRKALATAFQMEGGFNDVSLALAPGADTQGVIARLDRLLTPYGGLGAIPRAQQISHFFLASELTSLRATGEIVPVIFLAVAAFLLNVVLTRLVALQREQIAALKALGYANTEIGWHFVKWSLAIACAGAAIGTVAGALLGRAMTAFYTNFFHFPLLEYHLHPSVVIEGTAVALVSAAAGAIGAVRHVVSLPPAEAMRPEPPARYSVSWVERAGVGRWLSEPARIVLRNLQRHPGRAALSVLGIAFGGAMIVVGTFSMDSIDDVMDTQYNVAQVFDAAVTFNEPVSASAAEDAEHLPGVIRAEGFRAVPARLRAGARSRSVSILGLPERPALNRVVNASLDRVDMPPEGLVLSSELAKLLGVGRGDLVTVEVLEGARPVRRVPVARLVDEFMGTNAYMRIGALHALMREGGSLSGVYLQVAAPSLPALYHQLKATPAVAGVSLRQAAIDSFRDTVAESIRITRIVTIVFASIIAFGVVYNTARISLSERGRELATLRVIGFTRGEIASILLGELALITLAAVPFSMLIGYGLAALTVRAYETEVYRLPLAVTPHTYAVAALATIAAAAISAYIVRRRLDHLDLIAVLKTRE